MSLFRHFLREYLDHRAYGRHHRHRRSYGYGRRHRPRHPFVIGRPRRRTRVHVGGCCLPIPLGVLLATSAGARLALRRRRR
jgi:hypothetical protein